MRPDSSLYLLRQLAQHLSRRRRVQFGLLLVLMVFSSLIEVLSIGAVMPFLGVLTAPERVFSHPSAQPFMQMLGIAAADQLLLPITIAFAALSLMAGGTRLLLLWGSTRLTYSSGADLSYSAYQRTLYQPYAVHVARNSSAVIAGISGKVNASVNLTMQVLLFCNAVILIVSVVTALVFIDSLIAMTAMGGFGGIYLLITRLTRHKLKENSQRIARNSTQVIKALQEGLGGIRDVLIDGTQATYCHIYRSADLPMRQAQGSNQMISSSPRTGIEALSMVVIALLAYSMSKDAAGFGSAIPVLGTLALAAQRLLPAMQQAYAGWTSMGGNHASLKDALDLLNQPMPEANQQTHPQAMAFKQDITLKQAGFRYGADASWVFQNLNLTIPKGARVGFIGKTGSGKTTLLDVVMSLLPVTQGTLEVDGQVITPATQRAWQAHIAHVPQAIFLSDASLAENIAFGVPAQHIDLARVRLAAQQAQMAEVIESWPQQYNTLVGERGVRLSGGQRQRIGIARALYKQADVIIFDEATSALDNETEKVVMQAIEALSKNLTILIIAHRLTTLANCHFIVELKEGQATVRQQRAD